MAGHVVADDVGAEAGDLVGEGVDVDLATIPQEDAVYDMLCAADTVGVFQIPAPPCL